MNGDFELVKRHLQNSAISHVPKPNWTGQSESQRILRDWYPDDAFEQGVRRAYKVSQAVGTTRGTLMSYVTKVRDWFDKCWTTSWPLSARYSEEATAERGETNVSCLANPDGRPSSWLVDSGSCYHLLGKDDVPTGQKVKAVEPITLTTANGEVVHNESTNTWVKPLNKSLANVVVGDCPPVAGMGRLCIDDKMDFLWYGSKGLDPYLQKNGKCINLRVENYCP